MSSSDPPAIHKRYRGDCQNSCFQKSFSQLSRIGDANAHVLLKRGGKASMMSAKKNSKRQNVSFRNGLNQLAQGDGRREAPPLGSEGTASFIQIPLIHGTYFLLLCSLDVIGNVNRKVDPLPGSDSTQIRPLARSMMRLHIASPIPVPFCPR